MQSYRFLSYRQKLVSYVSLAAIFLTLLSLNQPAQAQGLSFPAEVNKSFSPISIPAGDVSRLSVTIYNSNDFQIDDAAWTDDLIGVQPGISIADPVNLTNTCGGTVTAVPGTTTLSLSGGTVPAQVNPPPPNPPVPGSCTVAIDVTSTTPGNLINTIPAGGLTGTGGGGTVTNTSPASATLQVDSIAPPSLNKNFDPNTIWVGQTSKLTINISNNDLNYPLTELSLTDNLPTGVVLDDPVSAVLTDCGSSASLTAVNGTDVVTLNDAAIVQQETCKIEVNVTSNDDDVYTNTIPAGEISNKQGVTNSSDAEAPLSVQAVGIEKVFSPTTFQAGESSSVTITIKNPTGADYTGVDLTDSLPAGLLVSGTPTTPQCGGTISSTATSVTLDDGTVPAGDIINPGSCTITFDVTTPPGAATETFTNTIPENALSTDQGISNVLEASAEVTVEALSIDVDKSYSPSAFQEGETSNLTVRLSNPTQSDFTNVNFADLLPAGLTLTGALVNNSCGGSVSMTPSTTLQLSNGTIPGGPDFCEITVTVTSSTPGSYTNTIEAGDVTSGQGVSNLEDGSGDLTVYSSGEGVTVSKSFRDASIVTGGNSRLRIDIIAPADRPLNNFEITDNLPAGVTISNSSPATRTGCGSATLTAATGADFIKLENGTIAAGQRCRIHVYVTSDTPDIYTNTIQPGDIKNTENQTIPDDVTANLRVSSMTMEKAFYPDIVDPNGLSTLTITLRNNFGTPLVNVSLTDNLPGNTTNGVIVAPTPNASTTCTGGVVSAAGQIITMTGGAVPAQVGGVPGICTISVDVQGKGQLRSHENTIPTNQVQGTLQGSATVVNPVDEAVDIITIRDLDIGVVKGFDPLTVFGGSASTMSVQLVNPNNAPLSGISFTDTMPTGMYMASPTNFSTGTCGGTLSGTPGSNEFNFTDGFLDSGRRCTLTLSVSMNVNGNRTNPIPAGGVTTFNGASNPNPAQATLTNLPGASVSKYFDPNPMLADIGNYSTLTITIQNTSNFALTGMGLLDTLPGTLPDGLYIANPPVTENTCGGTLTAIAGSQTIRLENGSLAGSSSCTLKVRVTGTNVGAYMNSIPPGSLTNNEGGTNVDPATDTLTVTASPQLQLNKQVSNSGPYGLGDTITYNITAANKGDVSLTNVTVSDPPPGVVLGVCTPTQPATLAPGVSMVCPASHVVDAADVAAGTYTNTAVGDSDQTDPVNDSKTVPIDQTSAMNIDKIVTSSGPYALGDSMTYDIVVSNIGNTPLSGVSVSDPGTGVVLGACVPAQPANLAVGASMTCAATHLVTQADIDSGSYSNTAYADSNETSPINDTAVVPITQTPGLSVFKQETSSGPYVLNDTINYEISVLNSGNQTLSGVSVTDPGAGAVLGTCTPTQPATLEPNEFITCTASHVVTQDDVDNGSYTNTAIGDSDQTGPGSGSKTVSISQNPSIRLEKDGTLDDSVVPPVGEVNVGDKINYTFTVTNIGTVTLSDITLTDTVGGVTIYGGPIASLAPGANDATTFTGEYTLTQGDIDDEKFENTATATGNYPGGNQVTGSGSHNQPLTPTPLIGTAKRVVGSPVEVSPGTWDVTYEFRVENYGNVTLNNVQITDNLDATFPAPTTYTIQSLSSTSLTVNWPGFDGSTDLNLLDGSDSLAVSASETLTMVVRVVPANSGPFDNTATASGDSPGGTTVNDDSQDGDDPDPDGNDDPTDNNDPTPLDFGPNLFDPPFGVKTLNSSGLPTLQWTMNWINNTNIVAINARVSDPIPAGTTYDATGAPSGYGVPGGAPAGSTENGVSCTDTSAVTNTTQCYYEGPTGPFLQGRIIWEGTLGPDLGVSHPAVAVNDIEISFQVLVNPGTYRTANTATIDADLNGDGDVNDPGEQQVASAQAVWDPDAGEGEALPRTGFTPGRTTVLPPKSNERSYAEPGDMVLEIPSLNQKLDIVFVPMLDGEWDVTWLGDKAGHLQGTAFPTWNGNTVITAHVWDAFNRPGPFAGLKKMKYGEQIKIHAWGQTYVYEVREIKLVTVRNVDSIAWHQEYDWLTLLTCEIYNPLNDNYLFRRLVRAVLVDVQ